MISKATLLARRSVEEFFEDKCTLMAAAISYYVLFSIFPLLIVLVSVLSLFLDSSEVQDKVVEAVLNVIPQLEEGGEDDLAEAVRGLPGFSSSALGVLGLLGMAWSASSMFGIIRRAINTANDLRHDRPFVQQKLLDLSMVVAVGIFFLASTFATGFLHAVRSFSNELDLLGDFAEDTGLAWDAASYLIPLVLSFVAFALLYVIVPATKVGLKDVWPGALFAAVLFEVGKTGFAYYLEYFSHYDVVYGSLGAVIAFLFWVYISAMILLLGAEVAAEYPRVMRGEYRDEGSKPVLPLRERVRKGVRSLFVSESGHKDEPGP